MDGRLPRHRRRCGRSRRTAGVWRRRSASAARAPPHPRARRAGGAHQATVGAGPMTAEPVTGTREARMRNRRGAVTDDLLYYPAPADACARCRRAFLPGETRIMAGVRVVLAEYRGGFYIYGSRVAAHCSSCAPEHGDAAPWLCPGCGESVAGIPLPYGDRPCSERCAARVRRARRRRSRTTRCQSCGVYTTGRRRIRSTARLPAGKAPIERAERRR